MDFFTEVFLPLFAVAVVVAAILLTGKRDPKNKSFDEMQLKLRSDAYRIGYIVTHTGLIIYLLLTLTVEDLDRVVEPGFAILTVLSAGLTAFIVYCILHDAFFSIGEKWGSYVSTCVVICVLQGYTAVERIADGSLWKDGVITLSGGMSLVIAAFYLIVLIALLARKIRAGKEADE